MTEYFFEGNYFLLEHRYHSWNRSGSYYSVEAMEVLTEELKIPDVFDGLSIQSVSCLLVRGAEKVTSIHIGPSCNYLDIRNNSFPNLTKATIAPGNQHFAIRDGMLRSADSQGSTLYCALLRSSDRYLALPAEISMLERHALQHTTCEELDFLNPDIEVKFHAFDGSRWLSRQGPEVIVGKTLLYLGEETDTLYLPQEVRKIHEDCFCHHVPQHLNVWDLPGYGWKHIGNTHDRTPEEMLMDACRTLTLRSPTADIRLKDLATWPKLEAVHVPEQHATFFTCDGVVFSADRKKLLFYPRWRVQMHYEIPEGTEEIGPKAFAQSRFLCSVRMPSSVHTLGREAFYSCYSLREVWLSEGLEELPDAENGDRRYYHDSYGVFEECKHLETVHLPESLRYIGHYAFHRCRLNSIHLPEKLEGIGHNALACSGLKSISLPSGLKWLGNLSLEYVSRVRLHENSYFTLSSVYLPSENSRGSRDGEWRDLYLETLNENGDLTDIVFIPEKLSLAGQNRIAGLWENGHLNESLYQEIFDEHMKESRDRWNMALVRLPFHRERDGKTWRFLRRSNLAIASYLAEENREDDLLGMIREDLLTVNTLDKITEKIREKNNLTMVAYLLQAREKLGQNKSAFGL